jgi:hypothetical protein
MPRYVDAVNQRAAFVAGWMVVKESRSVVEPRSQEPTVESNRVLTPKEPERAAPDGPDQNSCHLPTWMPDDR